MELAAKGARIGNKLLSWIAALLIFLLLTYGAYSLWDVYRVYTSGFASDDLLQFKPSLDGDNALSFAELRKINPDVKAWITIDKTKIDYPMVQGKDDMEYVNKDVHGEFSLSGAIFLSYKNKPDFTDAYNLTYGHHMDGGGMYGDVLKFEQKKYFDKHRKGVLYLPDKTYRIELYAVLHTDAYDRMIFDQSQAMGNMAGFQSYIKAHAKHYRDIGIRPEDRVISLITCADATTSGRTALIGRLVEMDGEASK